MNITSLGIGSGIDLESLVTAYIDAEAIPQEIRLQEKEDRLSLELSGVGSFKSSLSTFNDTLKKLAEEDAFKKQVVTSSSNDIEVKSNGSASNGEFEIAVTALAKGTKYHTEEVADSSSTVGNGDLVFGNGTDSFTVSIGAGDDLSAIRDKINENADNFGVTANIINNNTGSFLVYSSQVTGVANELTVTGSDPSLDAIASTNPNVTKVQGASDAAVVIDGVTITSDSNEFKNVIEDLTITVSAEVPVGSPAKISISQDKENGTELINEFIGSYNTLMEELSGLAAPKQGRLAFDPNVRQVKQKLTEVAIQAVSGMTGGIQGLSDVGVELNKEGRLQISTFSSSTIPSGQTRLDNALENNLDEVGQLFASTNGVAVAMSELIDTYIASDGVLTKRSSDLSERVRGIADEYEQLEDRLRSYEDRLRKQFTFLDGTVSQYNATGQWLTSTLANLTPKNE